MSHSIKIKDDTYEELRKLQLAQEHYDDTIKRLLLMGMVLAKLNDKIPMLKIDDLQKWAEKLP